jgi:hypothetical protein
MELLPDVCVLDRGMCRLRPPPAALQTRRLPPRDQFDVFLCHNSRDKQRVRRIAQKLEARGIACWLDENEIRPGTSWQRALEDRIGQIRAAAVFVGANRIGPWQQVEIDALLREFVHRGCPVIPVILGGTRRPPDLPVFLRGMHWVDFRKATPDPMAQLFWGITGNRHTANSSVPTIGLSTDFRVPLTP